jgi:hypothetical protein
VQNPCDFAKSRRPDPNRGPFVTGSISARCSRTHAPRQLSARGADRFRPGVQRQLQRCGLVMAGPRPLGTTPPGWLALEFGRMAVREGFAAGAKLAVAQLPRRVAMEVAARKLRRSRHWLAAGGCGEPAWTCIGTEYV